MREIRFTMTPGEGVDEDAFAAWMKVVVETLPDDTLLRFHSNPKVIDATELDESYIGRFVKFHHKGIDIEGKLEALFSAGGNVPDSRVLVVDGQAWTLHYGNVLIND